MKTILLSLVLMMGFSAYAENVPRRESKAKILSGCLLLLKSNAEQKQAICQCIVRNFDKKANDGQLELLAKEYTIEAAANNAKSTESVEIYGTTLNNFDNKVATMCFENPKWTIE